MKTAQLTIAYDAEKLAAIRQYAAKKDVSVEAELTETIDRLYEKLIPAQVREYLESRPEADTPARPARPPRPRNASDQTGNR